MKKGDYSMKQIRTRFSTVASYIVCAILAYIVIATLSARNPVLGALLIVLGLGLSFLVFLIWLVKRFASCKRWIGNVLRAILKCGQLFMRRKYASKKEIGDLLADVSRLRKTFFNQVQLDGQQLQLVFPENAALYAEFESLRNILFHLGVGMSNPATPLQQVRLQKKDLFFLQQLGGNLETRLIRNQQEVGEQWQSVFATLKTFAQGLQELAQTYVSIHVSYYQLQSELQCLQAWIDDPRCPVSIRFATYAAERMDIELDRLRLKQCLL
jgi:hypothetical protein